MGYIVRTFTQYEMRDGEEIRVLVCETPLVLSDLVDGFDPDAFGKVVEEAHYLMEKTGHDSCTVRNIRS